MDADANNPLLHSNSIQRGYGTVGREVKSLSTSSGESRAVKQSFASNLKPSPTGHITDNSDDDFRMRTVEQLPDGAMVTNQISPPSSPPPTTTEGDTNFSRSLSTSPVMSPAVVVMANGCPCSLNQNCRQDCCVQQLRAIHQARLERTSPHSKLTKDGSNLSSPYGSISSPGTGKGSRIASPSSMNYESDDSVSVAVTRRSSSPTAHCVCHEPVVDKTTRKAVIRLLIAFFAAFVIMAGEAVGGYLASSLAIMTDAAHMLSDCASFLISLFAIWVSRRPPSRGMSFGWHRAEVIGALISVLVIWVLTGALVYEAVLRVIHQNFEIDADIMLITAGGGVFINVFMCMVLGHGHGHSHGGGGGHGHAHGGGGGHGKKSKVWNINVYAAYIHVLGDLIQGIGVVIAGYIIWIWPSLKLADPICTFIFSLLVMISTINILKDALRVVMEGTPKNIDYEEVKADLIGLDGVKHVHSLHIWSLTLNKTALSAHLVLKSDEFKGDDVISEANQKLKEKHDITNTTLQVESYQQVMAECGPCQEPERMGVLYSLLPECLRPKRKQASSASTKKCVERCSEQC